MGIIAIEGIEVYAYHGVYPIEREKGNLYEVNVYLETDISKASYSDMLEDTLDYSSVYKLVLSCMEQPVNLIEYLTQKIGNQILADFPRVEIVKVKLAKIKPISMEKCQKTYIEMNFDRKMKK